MRHSPNPDRPRYQVWSLGKKDTRKFVGRHDCRNVSKVGRAELFRFIFSFPISNSFLISEISLSKILEEFILWMRRNFPPVKRESLCYSKHTDET